MRRRIGVRRDYESIYSLGVAFASFAAAESVHGSGYLAAFAAGVTISALDVELCDCFLEYGETTAEMALMFAFVLVGTSLIWTGLGVLGATTLLFTAAVFAARVVAFVPALLPARLSWPDRLLIAWFGPRGLSSLLLVLLPVFAGLAESERLVPICCLVVLCSVVLHGLSPMLLVSKDHAVAAVPGATAAPAQGRDGSGAGHKGLSATRTHHAGADSTPSDPEYISIEEVEALRRQSAPVVIVDARSERTYNESSETIPGSVRLHPDQAVRAAAASALPRDAVLAVFCA
jgi:NhaP-type Na+/H+ or K+/H+ antiporter